MGGDAVAVGCVAPAVGRVALAVAVGYPGLPLTGGPPRTGVVRWRELVEEVDAAGPRSGSWLTWSWRDLGARARFRGNERWRGRRNE